MRDKIFRNFTMLLTGSIIYFNFEIFVRGYSHISMFVLGGICFFLVGMIGNFILDKKIMFLIKLVSLMLMSSLIITSLELLTGLYVNLYLNLDVWDYSHLKGNYMGQICILYSMIWGLMGLPCVFFYGVIDRCVLMSKYEKNSQAEMLG